MGSTEGAIRRHPSRQPAFLLIERRDQIGFVSQYGAIVILGPFLLSSLFQPHPGASAILVDEFDTGPF